MNFLPLNRLQLNNRATAAHRRRLVGSKIYGRYSCSTVALGVEFSYPVPILSSRTPANTFKSKSIKARLCFIQEKNVGKGK